MRVLVVGSGGREHAIAWKISQSKAVEKLYCAPGNPGTSKIAGNVSIPANEIHKLADFASKNKIDLTVVGPEEPLVKGIVDEFQRRGLKIFGPRAESAILEGSKVFTQQFLEKYGIPAPNAEIFDSADDAIAFVKLQKAPVVVKADGLAAGKGVVVAESKEEAINAIKEIMVEKKFGHAGGKILLQEKLSGQEASFIVFSDGKNVKPLPVSQDHKRVFDGDEGPNTGGMGAYSPAPIVSDEMQKRILEEIIIPTVKAMAEEGREFVGILYAGLMIDGNKIKVLEFNCRLGDPEAQAILPRLDSDLIEVMNACVDGKLDKIDVKWKRDACCSVVLASKGYPEKYESGKVISGIEEAEKTGAMVFQAGTRLENGSLLSSGGRVLAVSALGKTIDESVKKAYAAVSKISFEGMHFRKDIGKKAYAMR